MVIVVHGGAGRWEDVPEADARAGCERAVREGWRVLAAGGAAMDAVLAAVTVLEEDPLYNAGRGACLTRDGTIELDAAIMDGASLRVGAVGAVPPVASAVCLARKVLEANEAVFLVGAGAARFAEECGVGVVPQAALETERARRELEETKNKIQRKDAGAQREEAAVFAASRLGALALNPDAGGDAEAGAGVKPEPRGGTVGAVAVDARGNVAAATSTGGRAGKRSGRVGDTPIAGAGTYADNELGAASATGPGEYIIRAGLTRSAVERFRGGVSATAAARDALARMLDRTGGVGGIIVVTPRGDVGVAHTTPRMPYAIVRDGAVESGFGMPRES